MRLIRAGYFCLLFVTSVGCGTLSATVPDPAVMAIEIADGHSAVAALEMLPVKGKAPMTGYDREEQFGPAWSDDVSVPSGHNGCDQRSDVLRRDLTEVQLKPNTQGCVPMSGTLLDPYTGSTINFVRGKTTSSEVQIEHVVALANSWVTGAQQLSPEQRQNLANDPLELLAVDGPTNQAKGAGDAATWLPPNKAFRCAYIARQIAVKIKYQLWVTQPEKEAMAGVLTACPDFPLPADNLPIVQVPDPVR